MKLAFLRRIPGYVVAALLLTGCVVAPEQPVYRPPPEPIDSPDVLPPLPTFQSLYDCERAYGVGACGAAPQVYAAATIAAPPFVTYWYMPLAYAALTGALVHVHLAPPSVFVATLSYRSYLAPVYVTRYRVVTPQVVYRYRTLPLRERETILRRGPVHPHARPAPVPEGRSRLQPDARRGPAQPAPAPSAAPEPPRRALPRPLPADQMQRAQPERAAPPAPGAKAPPARPERPEPRSKREPKDKDERN